MQEMNRQGAVEKATKRNSKRKNASVYTGRKHKKHKNIDEQLVRELIDQYEQSV